MAKKLSDIEKLILSSEKSFETYLSKSLGDEVIDYLDVLSRQVDVYIFSGVIRNFFLKLHDNRDIDIVLSGEVDIEKIFEKCLVKRNSFGGYKILINSVSLDLWNLENTWALKKQLTLDFELEKYIPSTAFFNFSSIIYSYNFKQFYYTTHFLRFLRDKEIDVVYRPNANYQLCVVNTLYYSNKYKLKVSAKMMTYIRYLYYKNDKNYEQVQLKHFGAILYTDDEIQKMVS